MPACRSITPTLRMAGLAAVVALPLCMWESSASEPSQPEAQRPGQMANAAWQRFHESDSFGALTLLHFSSYVELPVVELSSKLSLPEFAGDPDLILDVQRIRTNEFERFATFNPGNFDLWETKLTPFPSWQKSQFAFGQFGQREVVDDWALWGCHDWRVHEHDEIHNFHFFSRLTR